MINPTKKTIAFLLIALGWAVTARSQGKDTVQEAQVEKSIYGMQIGLLGLWGYHEWRLNRQITLRGEVGIYQIINLSASLSRDKFGFYGWPIILTIEQRWYYNLKKRMKRSKDITGNSGNFVSLQLGCLPYLFNRNPIYELLIGSLPNGKALKPLLSVLAMWGIRRNIRHQFNYEINLGFRHYIVTGSGMLQTLDSTPQPYLHFCIGYRF